MARALLADRYEILEDQPIPELDTLTAKAFVARDLRQLDASLFALKTSIFPPPRNYAIETFMDVAKQAPQLKMLPLIHAGNVTWSNPVATQSTCLIYSRPRGQAIMSGPKDTFAPWGDEQIINLVLNPIFEVLTALRNAKVTHRAIRPTNLFFDSVGRSDSVLMGDCLSTPVGYGQGVIFEPLSFAMADPIGRGESTITNDLFALGTTIAILLQGQNPCAHLSDDQIIEQRLEIGSYNTYFAQGHMNTRLIEVLRGLLMDDEGQRWGMKELGNWISSGRQSSQLPIPTRRASRPISLGNRSDIYTTPLLAHEMRANASASFDLISRNELSMWLKNSLNDNQKVHLLDDLNAILPQNASSSEKLLGVLQILDPTSPFFWQGRSMTGSGIGMSFAQAVHDNDHVDSIINLISSPVLAYYLAASDVVSQGQNQEEEDVSKKYQMARSFLEYKGFGGGVERCVYYLCPSVPCLSPYVKNYNVQSIEELLRALDHLGTSPQRPQYPIDRHIISYIATKEPNVPQRYIATMEMKSSQKKIVGMMKILAEIQMRHRIKSLPGLCKWFGNLSEPVINSYKNLSLQENLRKRLQATIESGNLTALVKLLDNRRVAEVDQTGLRQALVEVNYLEKMVRSIVQSLKKSSHYSENIGHNNAMLVATVVSFVIMSGYFAIKLLNLS